MPVSRKARYGTEILPIDKIKCISWENDIYKWLTALLIQLDEPVKSLVKQYIDAIRFIAEEKDDRTMENCIEALHESADYFKAGLQIEKSMKAAKLKLMRLVFDDFKTEMDKAAPKFGLTLENNFNYYIYADVPNFKEMNPCAVSLVDSQKRKEFVKNAVKVFEKQLLNYLL